MSAPRNPPSWIKCFRLISDVFFFTNSRKQSLYFLSLCFSSSFTGIFPLNTLSTQSQIQRTRSNPPSSIILFSFSLFFFTLSSAANSYACVYTLWAMVAEWSLVKGRMYLYCNIKPHYLLCVHGSCMRAWLMRACVRGSCVRACVAHACVRGSCVRACVAHACVRASVRDHTYVYETLTFHH